MVPKMICPMVTAFTPEGKTDYEANALQIERLIDGGVGGILFLGSIGEFSALSTAQKADFITFAVKQTHGRVRTLVGSACPALEDTLHLHAVAADAGADQAVVLPPYYFPADQQTLLEYYTALAKQTPLPFLMYNFPGTTGADITPATAAALAQSQPTIVGIKDTVDSISHTRALIQKVHPVRPDFEIFSGFDEYGLLNLMLGGSGVISGMNNLAPHVFKKLLTAFQTQDFSQAAAMQQVIFSLMPLYQVMPSFVQAIKQALAMLLPGYPTRMMISCTPATTEQQEAIAAILTQQGLMPSDC